MIVERENDDLMNSSIKSFVREQDRKHGPTRSTRSDENEIMAED